MQVTPADSTAASRGSFVRNAAIGMAIAYGQEAAKQLCPVAFCLKNVARLGSGSLHLLAPPAIAWFASHWSANMEQAIWGGSSLAKAIAFSGLWVVSMAAWSSAWIALGAIASGLGKSILPKSQRKAASRRQA